MSENKQTSNPLKGNPNVAPRGGSVLPVPPLQRDPAVSRPADGK